MLVDKGFNKKFLYTSYTTYPKWIWYQYLRYQF
jgi:hypothetical protein